MFKKGIFGILIISILAVALMTTNVFGAEQNNMKKEELLAFNGKTIGDMSFKIIQNDANFTKLEITSKDTSSIIELNNKTLEIKVTENNNTLAKGKRKDIQNNLSKQNKPIKNKETEINKQDASAGIPLGSAFISIPKIEKKFSSNLYAYSWKCISDYHDDDYYYVSQCFMDKSNSSVIMYYMRCFMDNLDRSVSKYKYQTSGNATILASFKNSAKGLEISENKFYTAIGGGSLGAIGAAAGKAIPVAILIAAGASVVAINYYTDIKFYKKECCDYYNMAG